MKIIKATKRYLTPTQRLVLNFAASYISEKGYSPTEQEIADFLGKDRSNAQKQIVALINKGYVRRDTKLKRRNIEVLLID